MSKEPSLDLSYYNDNRERFHQSYYLIKQLLGIMIIENLPIIEKSIQFKVLNRNNIYITYTINYKVNQNSKNNLNTDIDFEINKSNIITKIESLSKFILYLLINKEIKNFFTGLINYIINPNNEELLKVILSKIINLQSYNEIYPNFIIDLNDKDISFFNKLNRLDELVTIEGDPLENSNDYTRLLYTLITQTFFPIELDIFEIIELKYYGFIEEYLNYNESYKNINNLSNDLNIDLLSHKKVLFNHDSLKLTPLLKYSNIQIDNNILLKFLTDNQKIAYLSQNILNGRVFFKYNNKVNPLIDFSESKFYEWTIYSMLERGIRSLSEIKTKTSIVDDDFWNLFGLFINQFVIAEISLQLRDRETIGLYINLGINDPKKFSTVDVVSPNLLIKIVEMVRIDKFDVNYWRETIKKMKEYFESIFMTYPQHSTIIGCSDLLYYYNLYNYFPLLKKYRIPLAENIDTLISFIDSDSDLITYHLIRTPMLTENTIKVFNEYKKDLPSINLEISKLKIYINHTQQIMELFGMNFGYIHIDSWKNNQHDCFSERMDKYNTEKFGYTFRQTIPYTYLKNIIDFCVLNGYLYDINYFIENFIRVGLFGSSSLVLYENLNQVIQNIDEYNSLFSLAIEPYFILFAYKLVIPLMRFLHAGINILFIKVKPNDVLAIKLNKMVFIESELKEFHKMFQNISPNIHLTNLRMKPEYKFLNTNGILLENVDIINIYEKLHKSEGTEYNFIQRLREAYYDDLTYEKYQNLNAFGLSDISKKMYKELEK